MKVVGMLTGTKNSELVILTESLKNPKKFKKSTNHSSKNLTFYLKKQKNQ